MPEFVETNKISWNDYTTKFLTEKKLKEFLLKEAIPCLSCRFKEPRIFYTSIIQKLSNIEEIKKFKMIYTHLVHPSMCNYLSKEELIKFYKINKENILAEGSVTLIEAQIDKAGNKPIIRWMITKDD